MEQFKLDALLAPQVAGSASAPGKVPVTALAVFDHRIEDSGVLADGLHPRTAILHLDPAGCPLLAIAKAVETGDQVTALHLVAHGEAGAFSLAGHRFDADSIAEYARLWARIGAAMADGGFMTITACQVASGNAGQELLFQLKALCGKPVYGTPDVVGSNDPGSFALTGNVSPPYSVQSREAYAPALALSPVDLSGLSDDGVLSDDNVTSVTTPTITFTADPGDVVEIDWGDGNGFVAVSNGTGALQAETIPTPYAADGVKTIVVRVNGVTEQTLDITIDTTAPISDTFDNILNFGPGPLTGFSNIASLTTGSLTYLFTTSQSELPAATLRAHLVQSDGTVTETDIVSDDATLLLNGALP